LVGVHGATKAQAKRQLSAGPTGSEWVNPPVSANPSPQGSGMAPDTVGECRSGYNYRGSGQEKDELLRNFTVS